jgi:hypothetical protein
LRRIESRRVESRIVEVSMVTLAAISGSAAADLKIESERRTARARVL